MLLWALVYKLFSENLVAVFLHIHLRLGLLGHVGIQYLSFLKNNQAVVHSSCSILPSHQQCMKVPISPYPLQDLFSVILFFNYSYPAAAAAAAAARSLKSCPTLRDPIDGSPPGFPVPGILQARTLEWAAISFSNAWKWKVKVKSLNRVRLFMTPWTAAYQAPPSKGFSRQEYWSGVPLPSPTVILVGVKWYPIVFYLHFPKVYFLMVAQGCTIKHLNL